MKTVDLIPSQVRPASWPSPWADGLGEGVLLQNALWFIRIRWVVVAVLAALGLLSWWCPSFLDYLSLVPPKRWPWHAAIVLASLNGVYLFLVRSLKRRPIRRTVETCIWWQIGGDLLILTVLVHLVGSTDTFVSFAYVFHIVLACIFFAAGKSLLVTAISAVLFLGCLALEVTGVAPSHGVLGGQGAQSPILSVLHGLSAVVIWFVVWYLTSSISKAVRNRDRKLAEANERLMRADQEKNQVVLRTTHDLKAPFTGIESSIAVLRMRDWANLPESVRAVIESIEVRSATLRERIKDILELGELRQAEGGTALSETVDLDALLHAVVQELAARAAQRNVTVRLNVPHLPVQSNRRQLMALFSNLVANAIVYSYEGGSMEVDAENRPDGITVRVSDHGIGISEKALPRIFEEYFRTDEAVRFNKLSTGLGLSIVKEVAQSLGLLIHVTSEQGKGTSFLVRFPREGSVQGGSNYDCR